MSFYKTLIRYKKAYSNWFTVLYKIRRKSNHSFNDLIRAVLRKTGSIVDAPLIWLSAYSLINSSSNSKHQIVDADLNRITFKFKGFSLSFELGNPLNLPVLYESFFEEEYGNLSVNNEYVIDIGSNIGDTPIYFAIRGAKRIIALEPYPYTYSIAKRNIESSDFSDKISLINGGYGKDGEIGVDTIGIPDGGSPLRMSDNGFKIQLFSLETLLSKLNIPKAVLKMDCEGCEYNLLEEEDDTLRKFEMMQIEYHFGYKSLVEKLNKCGFTVKYTEPKSILNYSAGKELKVGFIFAKIDSDDSSKP